MYPGNYGTYGFGGGYVSDDIMGAALAVILVCLGIALLSLIFSAVMYVLHSLGLYTVAKRRGIQNPWLSWLPVANIWVLGSISDQYQYVAKGKVRNRRKLLLALYIATYVLLIVFWICYAAFIVKVAGAAFADAYADVQVVLRSMFSMLAVSGVMSVVAIVTTVFMYISYYDLFQSCNPNNASTFLVLSILFSFLLSIFVFACRKKDLGMPPRKSHAPQPAPEPEVIPPLEAEVVNTDVVEAQEEDFEE